MGNYVVVAVASDIDVTERLWKMIMDLEYYFNVVFADDFVYITVNKLFTLWNVRESSER
jgi:hypothetical protein